MSQPSDERGARPGEAGAVAIAAGAVFALALAAYLATLIHGLDYADNGELAAVAWTLGIAHPTGYPTITLIGHLFARLLPLRPIVSLNLLAALLTAASAGALVLLFDELLRELDSEERAPARAALAACAALAAAFAGTWWDQSRRFEVYSLHTLLMTLTTFLFLRFVHRGRGGRAFAFSLGLAFTGHLTTFLLAPAFLAYFALARGFPFREIRRLVGLAPWFGLGLTPFLYLPLRSAAGPRFDWDAPHTLAGFVRLLTARDYGAWLFTDSGTFLPQWSYFFRRLPAETGYLGLAAATIGIVWMAARAPRLAALAALLFATSIVFAGGYGIPDIGPYYLTAMLAFGLATAAGLGWTLRRFGARVALATGVAVATLTLVVNLPRQVPEPGSAVEDLARDLLEPLPARAVVLTSEWDPWMAGSFYLQEVENLRRDVTVVDAEALGRPWYLGELRRRAPDLCARIEPEMGRVLALAATSRGGYAEASAEAEAAYRALLDALVATSRRDRAVFVTRDEARRLEPRFRVIPEGLAFVVAAGSSDRPLTPPRWRFRPERSRRDVYGALTCELYARGALDRAYYEAGRDRDSLALRWLDLARSFDPGWRADQVAPQPWGARDMLGRSLGFFDALRGVDLARLKREGRRVALPADPAR